ncbi:MAG: hypothetical protein GEV28_25380 [Actinophytocola sp.]|uniref:hypothetical protein n=1 Tax=Actinophytocola sp. TaxID=1872138 RepID=UPI00132AA568|nr:hypothetical protein [Actinophytocola sp.]MPZ83545.1 hypothetical protein [Actinophytocola sp.]
MACDGSAERGLVLYGTFDNDVFYQLADPAVVSERQVTVVAGGQPGEYEERFVVDLALASQALQHFISSGSLHLDLSWVDLR